MPTPISHSNWANFRGSISHPFLFLSLVIFNYPMKPRKSTGGFCLKIFFLSTIALHATSTNWVTEGSNCQLFYKKDLLGNRIPDFSICGYEGGGVLLPKLPVKVILEPKDGDAGTRIQNAINEVSKLPLDSKGFRGVVFLRKGTYRISDDIRILADGVVLRGEGQGKNGTILLATGTRKRTLIIIGTTENRIATPHESLTITDSYVPVGATSFHIKDSATLHPGDLVIIHRPSTKTWIQALGMDKIPQNKQKNVVQWKPGSKDLNFIRHIVSIKDNLISIDAPICCALDEKFGGGELVPKIKDTTIQHVGIENLSGDSEFKQPEDENHGWVFIQLLSARDSWVRDVTASHFGYSCVYVESGSRSITVQDCTCIDPVSKITGGRRYSFALDGQLTLVLRCHARNGRHDFVMHSLAAGPNAFVFCSADEAHSDSGPHHRWSVGVLYDNVSVHGPQKAGFSSGQINIRNRGSLGTGHGWAGANQILWNCEADSIQVEQPPTAQNWAIGCISPKLNGDGYWESKEMNVKPKSLYSAQLRARLGKDVADGILEYPN